MQSLQFNLIPKASRLVFMYISPWLRKIIFVAGLKWKLQSIADDIASVSFYWLKIGEIRQMHIIVLSIVTWILHWCIRDTKDQ